MDASLKLFIVTTMIQIIQPIKASDYDPPDSITTSPSGYEGAINTKSYWLMIDESSTTRYIVHEHDHNHNIPESWMSWLLTKHGLIVMIVAGILILCICLLCIICIRIRHKRKKKYYQVDNENSLNIRSRSNQSNSQNDIVVTCAVPQNTNGSYKYNDIEMYGN